jgi:diguanylate cyclase (GGDEF)-like protein
MWAADMLRLGDQLRDPERSDPVTGLLNRESFQEAAERERRLSLEGPVESYLAVISVTGLDAVRRRYGEPMADLLLKEAAEILAGAIRHADHVGHVGGDLLAAVLVDCSGTEGAAAFCDRLGTTFSRVMRDRPESVGVSFAALSLGDFPSSEAALEAAAPDAGARRAPGRGEIST